MWEFLSEDEVRSFLNINVPFWVIHQLRTNFFAKNYFGCQGSFGQKCFEISFVIQGQKMQLSAGSQKFSCHNSIFGQFGDNLYKEDFFIGGKDLFQLAEHKKNTLRYC